MLRLLAVALAAALAASVATAMLPGAAVAGHEQRKVYVFVIDGLDGDVLDGPQMPFVSSLIGGARGAGATRFPRSRAVMVAETNPNHAAMLTGAYPHRSGITGNAFGVYGAIPDEDGCPRRERRAGPPSITSGESAGCLEVPTLFETVDRRRGSKHLTTALIAGKPKLARLFSTRRPGGGRYHADHIWAPCDEDEDYCAQVPINPITGYAIDDSTVMDEVIATTRRGVRERGRRWRPDFTLANFPQVDSAGHAAGRTGAAYDDAVSAADGEIRRFVRNQRDLGLWKRTIVILVSDHSMDDTPQLSKVSLADALAAGGVADDAYAIVGNGSAAHVYLAPRGQRGAARLLKRIRMTLTGVPGIAEALYRRPNGADGGKRWTIRSRHPGWGLWGRRTGDLVVTTVPGIGVLDSSEVSSLPFNALPGNHGGPHTRDGAFLITGGHPAIRRRTSRARAGNVDVNPTAMRLLGRRAARQVEGEFRREAFRVRRLERRR